MVTLRGVRAPMLGGAAAALQPTLTELTSHSRPLIINSPLDFVGHRITTPRQSGVGGPFDVLALEQLRPRVRAAIDDLHILARNSQLRAKVFGSSTRQKPLETAVRSEPLGLKALDDGFEDFPVEVSFDLFTLDTKETFITYRTSNHRSSIDSDSGSLVSMLESLDLEGRRITSLDTAHTHPSDLFPSLMDKAHYTSELNQVRARFGPQAFDQWRMSTTMELEPVVHQVRLSDWLR